MTETQLSHWKSIWRNGMAFISLHTQFYFKLWCISSFEHMLQNYFFIESTDLIVRNVEHIFIICPPKYTSMELHSSGLQIRHFFFQPKSIEIFFLVLHKNIFCGYPIEVLPRGALKEHLLLCFCGEIEKKYLYGYTLFDLITTLCT